MAYFGTQLYHARLETLKFLVTYLCILLFIISLPLYPVVFLVCGLSLILKDIFLAFIGIKPFDIDDPQFERQIRVAIKYGVFPRLLALWLMSKVK